MLKIAALILLASQLIRADETITPAFKVGEKLHYGISWFIFSAGKASLSVEEMIIMNGQNCYRLSGRAQSTILFFFSVDDRIESVVSESALLPFRYEKHLREGKYKKDQVVEFDPVKGTARYGDQEAIVALGSRDLLGAFYYFRSLNLPAAGQSATLLVHTDKKNYELIVEVLGKETIKVPAGKFSTIHIKPKLKFEGLWRQDGDIDIWLTDDDAHIPVKIKSKVKIIGSINLELAKKEP
ncbi:MAG: DUF3108 domain-containing protein [bacterium]|nr:DUF3108 domain-containing protein [bacterium]